MVQTGIKQKRHSSLSHSTLQWEALILSGVLLSRLFLGTLTQQPLFLPILSNAAITIEISSLLHKESLCQG